MVSYLDSNSINEKYELTANLTNSQADKLQEEVQKVQAFAGLLAEDLNTHPYQNSDIWTPRNWKLLPLAAIQGLNEEALTVNQVATTCMIASGLDEFSQRFQRIHYLPNSLMKIAKVDDPECRAIDFSFVTQQDDSREFEIFLSAILDKFVKNAFKQKELDSDSVENFKQVMREEVSNYLEGISFSERVFIKFKLPKDSLREISQLLFALKHIGFPFFLTEENTSETNLIIPSFSIFRGVLKLAAEISFDEISTLPIPVFGKLSTRKIIDYFRRGLTPISLNLSVSPLPKNPDDYFANALSFTFHDGFHATQRAALSPKDAKGVLRLIDLFEDLALSSNNTEMRKAFKRIAWLAVDENIIYDYSQNNKFGEILQNKKIAAALPINSENGHSDFLLYVIRDMIENKEKWDDIQITVDDLLENQRALYFEIESQIRA